MVAGSIVMFLIASGSMRAAHDGKFLERYNSIFSVLRGVAGAAGVVPVFGLSLVQMMVLSCAGLGFQLADNIAEKTATYLSTGRPLTTFPAFYDQHKDKALLALLQLETCKAYLDRSAQVLGGEPLQVMWDKNELRYGEKSMFGGRDTSCGSLSVDAHYYQVAKYAIDDTAKEMREIAKAIINHEKPNPQYLTTARKRLKKLDKELTDVATLDVDKEAQDGIANFAQSVNVKGWMTLGTWYYTISEQTARFNQRVSYDFTPEIDDFNNMIETDLGGVSYFITKSVTYLNDNGVEVAEIDDAETIASIHKNTIIWHDGLCHPLAVNGSTFRPCPAFNSSK